MACALEENSFLTSSRASQPATPSTPESKYTHTSLLSEFRQIQKESNPERIDPSSSSVPDRAGMVKSNFRSTIHFFNHCLAEFQENAFNLIPFQTLAIDVVGAPSLEHYQHWIPALCQLVQIKIVSELGTRNEDNHSPRLKTPNWLNLSFNTSRATVP